MMVRHLVLMVPLCALFGLLPGAWGIRVATGLLALLSSIFVVTVSAGDIRRARLRQHGLPVPDDPRRDRPYP
jgi:hypothetical protein